MQLTALPRGTTTSIPKSAVFELISSLSHLACFLSQTSNHQTEILSVETETRALCRQPNGPYSCGKGQQGVESDLACSVWCRNAVWLGDSDDLCAGVSGVCCGCWGALFW